MKRPAFQFYPADWRKDAALQSCSLAAQGLWINLMCIAHECEPYGHLTINGQPMNSAKLARLVGVGAREFEALLDELRDALVCDFTDAGVIFSRRMVRDEEARRQRAEVGRHHGLKGAEHGAKGGQYGGQGGRPSKAETPGDNPGSKPRVEPPQNPRPSSSSSSSPSGEETSLLSQAPPRPSADGPQLALVDGPSTPPKGVPDCPHLQILALWAEVLPALPQHKPELWRGARADHLRARWRETAASKAWPDVDAGLKFFRRLFAYVGQSAFLTGRAKPVDQGRPPFVIELAWLVEPTNWAKVIEGKFHQDAA